MNAIKASNCCPDIPGSEASTTVDISDLFLEYARKFPHNKEVHNAVNWKDLRHSDIDFSELTVVNQPVRYLNKSGSNASDENNGSLPNGNGFAHGNGELAAPRPRRMDSVAVRRGAKSHVLFGSTFINNTTEPQRNHLMTERRTTSTCRVTLQRAVTKSGNLSLQVGPPNTVVQANGGFRREMCLTKTGEKTFEEELVWTLNTEIVVPPGFRTRANLVITEEEYDGHFETETIFEGCVVVGLRHKKDASLAGSVVITNLRDVLTSEHGFTAVPGRPNAVRFVNQGRCFCHYGINQRVDVHQTEINNSVNNDNCYEKSDAEDY